MKKHLDYDDTDDGDEDSNPFDAGLATEAKEPEPFVPQYTNGANQVQLAAEQDLIPYSSRPPQEKLRTFVLSGVLSPYREADVAIRLSSTKRFKSVAAARAYCLSKFGVVFEDRSEPSLGYWAFVLPVIG